MKYLILAVLYFGLVTSAYSKRQACSPKEFLISDLISKVKKIDKESPDPKNKLHLATMYMIASIHDSYTICAPYGSWKEQEWGHFMNIYDDEPKVVFWNGDVKNKSYLIKAKEVLKTNEFKSKDLYRYNSFMLGWVYFKMDETDKAIDIFQKTYEQESVKVDKSFFCKTYMCIELRLTLESLQYLHNIYEKKKNKEKMFELETLIAKYRKKIVPDLRQI